MSVLDFLGKELLYFDGAMGTRLQAAGLKPGELPEVWNITHGDVVAEIHASYVRAGANILKSIQHLWRQRVKDAGFRVFCRGRGAGSF